MGPFSCFLPRQDKTTQAPGLTCSLLRRKIRLIGDGYPIPDFSKAKDFVRSITTRSDRFVVHHIVAKRAAAAEPARRVLESVGINPKTNGLNLATIPERYHAVMHTANYYSYINSRFYGLEGNENAVVAALAELQMEIQLYCQTGIKLW